ncbi:MAG: hypothetical protein ABI548_26160 [Polyangiaceae bacterium]
MSRTKHHPVTLALGAIALFTVGQALFLGSSGCSSGNVCYRVTDCPIGDGCVQGTCTHTMTVDDNSTGGTSGSASTGGSSGLGTMTGMLVNSDAGAGGATSDAGAGGAAGEGGMGGDVAVGEAGMSGASGISGA